MKRITQLRLLASALVAVMLAGCELFGFGSHTQTAGGVFGSVETSPITVVSGNLFPSQTGDYAVGVIEVRNDGDEPLGFIKATYRHIYEDGTSLFVGTTFVNGSTLMTSAAAPIYTGTCLRPGETGYLAMIDNTGGRFSADDVHRIEVAFEWNPSTFVEPELVVTQIEGPTVDGSRISGTVRNDSASAVEIWPTVVVAWNSAGQFVDWDYVYFDDVETDSVDESILAASATADWDIWIYSELGAPAGAALMLDWEPPEELSTTARSVAEHDPYARLAALRKAHDHRAREALRRTRRR